VCARLWRWRPRRGMWRYCEWGGLFGTQMAMMMMMMTLMMVD
jgi:hypothetical protein